MTALVAVFVLYGGRHVIYVGLNSLRLIPHEEPITELYFESPLPVLPTINVNDQVAFSFTIHNMEGATTTYQYRVYALTASGTSTVEIGTISLADTAYGTRREVLLFTKASRQAEIFVELTDPVSEVIHFKLTRFGP